MIRTTAARSAVAFICLAAAAAASTPTRDTMHKIFDRMAELLPLVLDDEHFLEDATQARFGELLGELVQTSDALIEHAADRDADFRYHAEELTNDFREARQRQEHGRPEEARFFVITATQSCVGCHSRLPKARNFPLAHELTSKAPIQSLDAAERALFHIATRAFDSALTELETFLLDPATDSRLIEMSDSLDHYLTTAIRVERDVPRTRRFLASLSEREGLGQEFRGLLRGWSSDLESHAETLVGPADFDAARAIVDLPEAGPTRAALARDLVASSLLHRIIDAGSAEAARRAEAYYWLGVVGDRHATTFWRPETAVHLERAIRLAPDSAYAEIALDRLKSHWEFMYGGSQGSHLPRSAWETLGELKRIVEEHRAGASPNN